jgi:hypothetical protein
VDQESEQKYCEERGIYNMMLNSLRTQNNLHLISPTVAFLNSLMELPQNEHFFFKKLSLLFLAPYRKCHVDGRDSSVPQPWPPALGRCIQNCGFCESCQLNSLHPTAGHTRTIPGVCSSPSKNYNAVQGGRLTERMALSLQFW